MSEPTARELLLAWKESSIMERRTIEGQMRGRAMPIRLPTEEAIVYALIDWLEDVEKRLAKRKPAAKKKRAKTKRLPRPVSGVSEGLVSGSLVSNTYANGEAA